VRPSLEGPPIAATVPTTRDRTIVPDPIPAGAETVLPYELTRYEQNGYGRWSYGPRLEPTCSYNAELVMQLSPEMRAELNR
jgi:hypothetical protein